MRVLLVLLVLGSIHLPADADVDRASSDALKKGRAYFSLGLNHFELKQYEQAIADFKAGYALTPRPLFLYNIAQSARATGKRDMAIEYYRKYVAAETDPTAPEVEDAGRWIDRLSHAAASTAGASPEANPSSPPAAVESAPASPVSKTTAAPASAVSSQVPPPPASPAYRWYEDRVGDALCVAGIAAIGVGGGVLGDAMSRIGNARASYSAFLDAHAAVGERTAGVVVLGVGAALLVGGVVRYVWRARKSRRDRRAVAASSGRLDGSW